MPFAGLLTSPVAPAAVHSMMGGHGRVYVQGYGGSFSTERQMLPFLAAQLIWGAMKHLH